MELDDIIEKLQIARDNPEFDKKVLLECSARLISLFNKLTCR